MKKKYSFIILLFLPFLSFSQSENNVSAQSLSYTVSIVDSLSSKIESLRDSLLRIQQKLSECQLKQQTNDDNCYSLHVENSLLKGKVARADSLIVRIMNNRLRSRYDKENVIEVLADYKSISDANLKKNYKYRESLLELYGFFFNEVFSCIDQMQQDPIRKNKFQMDEYKEKSLKKLKSLTYYNLYYSKSGEIHTISYLDHIIDLVEKELDRHGRVNAATGREYISDFTIILNEMRGTN